MYYNNRVINIRERNWLKTRSTHNCMLSSVKLSKIRLWTSINANSAKCHLRPQARSWDLWTSQSCPRSWNEGSWSRLGRIGLGIEGLGLGSSPRQLGLVHIPAHYTVFVSAEKWIAESEIKMWLHFLSLSVLFELLFILLIQLKLSAFVWLG